MVETRLSSKGAKVKRDGVDPPPSQGYIVQYKLFPAAKSLPSCPTLCDPIDGSLGSPVPGILQARTLEWVAISFSNAGK